MPPLSPTLPLGAARSRERSSHSSQSFDLQGYSKGPLTPSSIGFHLTIIDSDHYAPLAKALRLSPHVYSGQSIAAVAVAAHEAVHAIQDKVGYPPLVWRSALVPLCNSAHPLPTEFNASNRAKAVLANTGIVSTRQEADGVKRVLDAAALTYVAGAAASLLQLIDLVLRQRR